MSYPHVYPRRVVQYPFHIVPLRNSVLPHRPKDITVNHRHVEVDRGPRPGTRTGAHRLPDAPGCADPRTATGHPRAARGTDRSKGSVLADRGGDGDSGVDSACMGEAVAAPAEGGE